MPPTPRSTSSSCSDFSTARIRLGYHYGSPRGSGYGSSSSTDGSVAVRSHRRTAAVARTSSSLYASSSLRRASLVASSGDVVASWCQSMERSPPASAAYQRKPASGAMTLRPDPAPVMTCSLKTFRRSTSWPEARNSSTSSGSPVRPSSSAARRAPLRSRRPRRSGSSSRRRSSSLTQPRRGVHC